MVMQIQYENTVNDMIAFGQHNFRTSPHQRRAYWINALLSIPVGIAYVLFVSWQPLQLRLLIAVIIVIAGIIINWFYYRWWIKYSARKSASEGKNKGLFGIHTVTISENGLRETTAVNDTHNSWEGVERIEESESHIFIYIGANQAYVIPKQAFASKEQADEFIQKASFYQSNHGR